MSSKTFALIFYYCPNEPQQFSVGIPHKIKELDFHLYLITFFIINAEGYKMSTTNC